MELEERWSAPAWCYPLLVAGCGLAFYLRKRSAPGLPLAFLAFQDRFLNPYLLAILAYSLQNVCSEELFRHYGLNRKEMAKVLSIGRQGSLLIGIFLGLSADRDGRKRICLVFPVFQVLESMLKLCGYRYALYIAEVCNGASASILFSAFITWMISEHDKNGFVQEWIGDTFCMSHFFSAAASLLSFSVAKFVVSKFGLLPLTAIAFAPAVFSAWLISNSWSENIGSGQGCAKVLQAFRDQKVTILGLVQSSLDLSVSVFWLLWVPTIVADGRKISAGGIYALLVASSMLGSLWACLALSLHFRPERFLPPIFLAAGTCLMVHAYDYQEIWILVASSCAFHVCVGVATPSLARLQSIYISSGHRAGVLAMYQVPTSIILTLFLLQGSAGAGVLENSDVLWTCATANAAAACGMYVLSRRSDTHSIKGTL